MALKDGFHREREDLLKSINQLKKKPTCWQERVFELRIEPSAPVLGKRTNVQPEAERPSPAKLQRTEESEKPEEKKPKTQRELRFQNSIKNQVPSLAQKPIDTSWQIALSNQYDLIKNRLGSTYIKPIIACDIIERSKERVYSTFDELKELLAELNDVRTIGSLKDCKYTFHFTPKYAVLGCKTCPLFKVWYSSTTGKQMQYFCIMDANKEL